MNSVPALRAFIPTGNVRTVFDSEVYPAFLKWALPLRFRSAFHDYFKSSWDMIFKFTLELIPRHAAAYQQFAHETPPLAVSH